MHKADIVLVTVQLGVGACNVARVTFTVHQAGEYRIGVMVASVHIVGSPFIKRFKPGKL